MRESDVLPSGFGVPHQLCLRGFCLWETESSIAHVSSALSPGFGGFVSAVLTGSVWSSIQVLPFSTDSRSTPPKPSFHAYKKIGIQLDRLKTLTFYLFWNDLCFVSVKITLIGWSFTDLSLLTVELRRNPFRGRWWLRSWRVSSNRLSIGHVVASDNLFSLRFYLYWADGP